MKHITFLLLCSSLFLGCSDIIERNIRKEKINILSPSNGLVSSSVTITFWWDEVKGAREYELHIVKPSFASIQELVLDTVMETTKFIYTFRPGLYEWRIRAVNGSSETGYFTYTFQVDSTLDLSNQKPLLTSPANNSFLNSLTQKFKWNTIYLADRYMLEIWSGSNMLFSKTVTTDTSSYTFSSEGDYQWRILALNNYTASQYSGFNNLSIDTTAPSMPILQSPANNSTVATNPVKLTWISDTGAVSNRLTVYTDSAMTTLLKDTTTALQEYSFSDSLTTGNYFWRVRSADKAGNIGTYSTPYKFSRP